MIGYFGMMYCGLSLNAQRVMLVSILVLSLVLLLVAWQKLLDRS